MLSADWELEWLHKMVFGSYSERIIATRRLGRYCARPRDEVIESQLAVLANERCSQLYRFAVQEIMSNAASWMDRPLFEEMLSRAEEIQRLTGYRFGVVHQAGISSVDDSFHGNQIYTLLGFHGCQNMDYLENARFWIPPEHPWFPEVVERLGEGLGCAQVTRAFRFRENIFEKSGTAFHQRRYAPNIGEVLFFTNLPAHYIAIIGGYQKEMEWFYRHGFYGQGWLETRPGERPQVRFNNIEKGKAHPQKCSNVLTAALWSSNPYVVRFVLEHFPQVQPRREMLYPLSWCRARLIRWLLDKRPEFWNIITLKDVLRMQDSSLLDIWLKGHPQGLPAGYRVPPIPDRSGDIYSAHNFVEFYSLLIQRTAGPDDRQRILRQFLRMMASNMRRSDMSRYESCFTRWDISSWIARLLPEGTDLTPLLKGQENKWALFRSLLRLWAECSCQSLSVSRSLDIYSLSTRMVRGAPPKMLRLIKPTRILPRPDPVTTELSKTFTLDEMEEMGLVTPLNRGYVLLSKRGPDYMGPAFPQKKDDGLCRRGLLYDQAQEDIDQLKKLSFGSLEEKEIVARGLSYIHYKDEIASKIEILSADPCSDRYRFAVQEIMDKAASWMDRPLFEEMLARAEEFQRRTGAPFGVVHRSDGFIKNARFWIPPQHPWFPEVQKRLGEGLKCASASHVFHFEITVQQQMIDSHKRYPPFVLGGWFLTNLPAHYVAIIGGYRKEMEWFYQQGAYGQGWLEKDPEKSPRVRFLSEMEGRSIPRTCSNVLTAALWSGNPHVLRFVFERFPQVQPRREMLYPLSWCFPKLMQWVLHKRQDLWTIITLEDVLTMQNPDLLAVWLKHTPGELPAGYHTP